MIGIVILISIIVTIITVGLCFGLFVMVFPDEISDYLNAKTEALRAITEQMKNETDTKIDKREGTE